MSNSRLTRVLEGYNFHVNGKVSNVVVTEVLGTKNYLFTAIVKHSQALSILPLKVLDCCQRHRGSYLWTLLLHGWSWRGLCTCKICALCSRSQHKIKQQMSSTSSPCAWLPCNYQFVPVIKISLIDFKTPRAKRQASLVCSEELIDESAVQTKKVCKMSPPTPEQMMQFHTRLSKTKGSPVVLSHTAEFSDKYVPVNKIKSKALN